MDSLEVILLITDSYFGQKHRFKLTPYDGFISQVSSFICHIHDYTEIV